MNQQKEKAMRLTRITLLIIACLLPTALMASGENQAIEIGHSSLNPAEISLQAGETVTFVNRVEMPGGHSVVADDNSFASPPLKKDESWDHTFEKAGTFAYHVKEHPDNKGVIHVK